MSIIIASQFHESFLPHTKQVICSSNTHTHSLKTLQRQRQPRMGPLDILSAIKTMAIHMLTPSFVHINAFGKCTALIPRFVYSSYFHLYTRKHIQTHTHARTHTHRLGSEGSVERKHKFTFMGVRAAET